MKSKSNLKKPFRGLSYLLYLATAVVLLLEIGLRIYNPFPQKMRGYKWELSTNTTYKLENISRAGLDKTIVNKRNSIGFRGVDPSSDIKNDLTAVTIGGSTTACTYLTEGKTWTDELGEHLGKKFNRIWINNAGIDGHSSFG
ncbi:MAG TPA: hypothetical protein VKR32_10175, partial [Puia sp.]|nr:hypothetical protein [Puia sp.]